MNNRRLLTLLGAAVMVPIAAIVLVLVLVTPRARPFETPVRSDAAVPPTYAANRASSVLVERALAPSPATVREAWTGAYAGQLAIDGGVQGSMPFHFDLTELPSGGVHVRVPGMLEVDLVRAPHQPNLAAARSAYSIPVAPYHVKYEIAAAMRDDRLQIAIVTEDSTLPDHPEIPVPGSRSVGAVDRTR